MGNKLSHEMRHTLAVDVAESAVPQGAMNPKKAQYLKQREALVPILA